MAPAQHIAFFSHRLSLRLPPFRTCSRQAGLLSVAQHRGSGSGEVEFMPGPGAGGQDRTGRGYRSQALKSAGVNHSRGRTCAPQAALAAMRATGECYIVADE